jgi:hypothetical protein
VEFSLNPPDKDTHLKLSAKFIFDAVSPMSIGKSGLQIWIFYLKENYKKSKRVRCGNTEGQSLEFPEPIYLSQILNLCPIRSALDSKLVNPYVGI